MSGKAVSRAVRSHFIIAAAMNSPMAAPVLGVPLGLSFQSGHGESTGTGRKDPPNPEVQNLESLMNLS